METSQPENHDHLFFHHQRNPVRQYRRVRKEPEELPQALRYFKYANLNPRIAAFLGKQDPKSLLKRAKGGKPDGKEVVASAPSVGVGLLGGEFRNDLSMEARSLLPDIGKGMGHLSFEDDQFAHSRLSFTNEADDPQRYQFEETTFAAPNILRELADTLNRFQIAFKEYAQRTTLYDPETGDPVATESTSPSILLPPAVTTLLCQGWKDVTAGATFASRVWQSTAYQAEYKYAATMQSAKQEAAQATLNNLGMPKVLTPGLGEKTGPTISSGLKSIFDLLEESRNKTHSKRDGANADSRTMTELKKSKAISKDIALLGVSDHEIDRDDHSGEKFKGSKRLSRSSNPGDSKHFSSIQEDLQKSQKKRLGSGANVPQDEQQLRKKMREVDGDDREGRKISLKARRKSLYPLAKKSDLSVSKESKISLKGRLLDSTVSFSQNVERNKKKAKDRFDQEDAKAETSTDKKQRKFSHLTASKDNLTVSKELQKSPKGPSIEYAVSLSRNVERYRKKAKELDSNDQEDEKAETSINKKLKISSPFVTNKLKLLTSKDSQKSPKESTVDLSQNMERNQKKTKDIVKGPDRSERVSSYIDHKVASNPVHIRYLAETISKDPTEDMNEEKSKTSVNKKWKASSQLIVATDHFSLAEKRNKLAKGLSLDSAVSISMNDATYRKKDGDSDVEVKIVNRKIQQFKENLNKKLKAISLFGGLRLLAIPEDPQTSPPKDRSGSVAVKNKDRSMKSTVNLLTGQQEETFAKVPRHGGSAVFSFNLSSKKAQEEGWITKESEPEPGERNMWLWAAARLRSVIKEKEEEAELAKSKGCYKPMLLRYYGDSRRETLMKLYKKGGESDGKSTPAVVHSLLPGKKHGVPKIPQLSKLYSGGKDKFMVQLPDGSITVYYAKTEELAIMASAVPDEPGQVYVNCYDNDEAKTCLASFTPYGESCCYHKNGAPGLILTDVGGLLKSEDGSVVKKWEWDSEDSKRKENILFNLNKEMYVRVISKSNILLNFCSNRETIKIPVGAKPNVVPPRHSAELGNLQSGLPLTSKAAEELGNLHRGAKPKTASPFKSRKNQFAKKWLRKPAEIEELRRSTDPPMRFEFESQADRELQRLKSKTRLLVDHWLENYRLAVGVRSPALKHMSSKTVIRTVNRDIQSARERKVSSLSDSEFGDKDGKFQSFRCPSAPPRHMVPGPNSITVKEEKKKTFPLSSTKKTEPHVRIDESPSHATTSKSGKIRSSLSAGTVASGSQRIALHSSRSPQRGHKSILRTTSVSSAPSSREKSWSPVNDCCPVATRNRLLVPVDKQNLAESKYFCKCSNNHMPLICDLEFDHFLHLVVPVAQLVVICVINSLYPKASPHDGMLDRLYIENNRNRSNPCKQGRNDQYRLLRYDLAIAKLGTQRSNPLLLGRHNVVPGMTLMYCGGRLLFADHIFNGYGNAKNDIRKQIFRTKREYFRGRSLPDDFRFTPGQGRPGARSAWGGEMGGAGVDRKGSPGMFFRNPTTLLGPGKKAKSAGINITSAALLDVSQSSSDLTSRSSDVVLMPASKSFNTARDFVQFSLSSQIYVPPLPRPTKRRTPTLEVPVRFFPTKSSTSRSVPKSGNSVSSNDVKNFARLQTVK